MFRNVFIKTISFLLDFKILVDLVVVLVLLLSFDTFDFAVNCIILYLFFV